MPAQVLPNSKIHILEIITNNSTLPSTIANITGIMKNDAGLTPTETPTPTYKLGLNNNELAIFSWTFNAPSSDGLIKFNASYVGAPSGAFVEKTVDVSSVENSQSASSSEWAEKARRVGILISGLPNPLEGGIGFNDGKGKFGIGIINPLDRPVEVYALALSSPLGEIFKNTNPIGTEPVHGWSTLDLDVGEFSVLLWESSQDCTNTYGPRIVPGESIVEWKVELPNDEGDPILEAPIFVESLTSEGKLLAIYTLTSDEKYPTMNIFYTDDISDPLNNWTYKFENIPSGQRTQYNATVQNSSEDRDLTTEVAMTIFIPKDFTNIQAADGQTSGPGPDWDDVVIVKNPDASHFIKVNSTGNSFLKNTYSTFSFNVTAPVVTEKSLYVFATTTFYPKWSTASQDPGPEIASAISEAGIMVNPGSTTTSSLTHGPFTFDNDNDADEDAWTWVSDNGPDGLRSPDSVRSWSHEDQDTDTNNVGPESGECDEDKDGYAYTEAGHDHTSASFDDTFHMTFDTTLNALLNTWQIEFYTNQRGNDNDVVGQVQINESGGGWVNVGSSFGGSGDPNKVSSGGNDIWAKRTVDLSNGGANTDSSTQVRILLTFPSSGTIEHNDYGIDTITISGTVIP